MRFHYLLLVTQTGGEKKIGSALITVILSSVTLEMSYKRVKSWMALSSICKYIKGLAFIFETKSLWCLSAAIIAARLQGGDEDPCQGGLEANVLQLLVKIVC